MTYPGHFTDISHGNELVCLFLLFPGTLTLTPHLSSLATGGRGPQHGRGLSQAWRRAELHAGAEEEGGRARTQGYQGRVGAAHRREEERGKEGDEAFSVQLKAVGRKETEEQTAKTLTRKVFEKVYSTEPWPSLE